MIDFSAITFFLDNAPCLSNSLSQPANSSACQLTGWQPNQPPIRVHAVPAGCHLHNVMPSTATHHLFAYAVATTARTVVTFRSQNHDLSQLSYPRQAC
jgi:hypothetical protein